MLDGALRTDCDATDKVWLLRCRISRADEESGPPGKLLPHCRREFLGRDPLHFAAEKFFAPPNDFVPSRRIDLGTERIDRKSTRLNSSHSQISYAVFCLKKKKKHQQQCCYYTKYKRYII